MTLSDKQRGVRKGMVSGAAIVVLGLLLGIAYSPISLTPDADVGERLAFVFKADILIAVWLAISIGRLARHRFFTPEDIDGGGLSAGSQQVQILQSLLQNTLEQSVLAVFVHLIWVVVMPTSWAPAVLAAAIMFFVGRALFSIAYEKGAPSRALGFVLTFYPSVLMLAIIVVKVILELMR